MNFAFPQIGDEDLATAYQTLYYPRSNNGKKAEYENTPTDIFRQVFRYALQEWGNLMARSLLDYGCGKGRLCGVAQEFGLRPVGIDPNLCARQEVREFQNFLIYSDIRELLQENLAVRFDLITIWDVIEHLREPWVDLRKLHNLLKPGGRLLVATVNTNCLRAGLEGPRWQNYANCTHFYYFTRQSLVSMLQKCDFAAVREWRVPIVYPHHGTIRRILNRALTACRLNGEMLFVAEKTPELT